jgi:hypothetical protein
MEGKIKCKTDFLVRNVIMISVVGHLIQKVTRMSFRKKETLHYKCITADKIELHVPVHDKFRFQTFSIFGGAVPVGFCYFFLKDILVTFWIKCPTTDIMITFLTRKSVLHLIFPSI